MSDSAGPSGGVKEDSIRATAEAVEIRLYILEMIEQLVLMAAVHGQDDLVAALSAARVAQDTAPLN